MSLGAVNSAGNKLGSNTSNSAACFVIIVSIVKCMA